MNVATSAMIRPSPPTTNTSPLITPRAAMPRVSRNRKAAADQKGAVAHAELAVVERAEQAFERRELPAVEADREALGEQVGQTQCARRDQDGGERRLGPAPPDQRERREERQGDRRQPPLAEEQRLQERGRKVIVQRIAVDQPLERPEAVVEGVPGQDRIADPADGQPQDDGPVEPHLPLTPMLRRKRPLLSLVTPALGLRFAGPCPVWTSRTTGGPMPPSAAPRSRARMPGSGRGMTGCRSAGHSSTSARQRVDLLVPLLEQADPLVRRAVLREVVVDQIDLLEIGSLRRRRGAGVGGRPGTPAPWRRAPAPPRSAPSRTISSRSPDCVRP